MANEVAKGSPGAAIIAEEERLFGQVQARVAMGEEDDAAAVRRIGSRCGLVVAARSDLGSPRRGSAAARRADDAARGPEGAPRRRSLAAGRHHVAVLRAPPAQARAARAATSWSASAASSIAQSNVQIVDWRNAPISRIYYRYEEGDDYEEEIAGRRVEGVRRGAPQRLDRQGQPPPHRHAAGHVPERTRAARGSRRSVRSRRSSTAAWARPRVPVVAPGQKGKLGIHHGVARADKALPEIAALIDKEQFELITQPSSGIVVIQGGAGSGKTTVALHRVAYLNFQDPQAVQAAEHAVRRAVAGARPLRRRRAAGARRHAACRS